MAGSKGLSAGTFVFGGGAPWRSGVWACSFYYTSVAVTLKFTNGRKERTGRNRKFGNAALCKDMEPLERARFP